MIQSSVSPELQDLQPSHNQFKKEEVRVLTSWRKQNWNSLIQVLKSSNRSSKVFVELIG
jgi:hypothetical protein